VRFWGNPSSARRQLRFAAADFAMHRIRFSAFAFDDADLENYWRRCLKFKPDYFYGYVSMLVQFARFLEDQGFDGSALHLKVIVCTSEVLTPSDRELLVRTFGCPVQNEYGCGEVGPIAYSCPEGRLHVMSTNVRLEVVDSHGHVVAPGESGEILVTDLGNYAMPLIRYRVGDRGILSEDMCPCGRPFPVLESIWGRSYDFICTPDGKRYHGEFFMYMFEDLRQEGFDFARFQVRQKSANHLLIRLLAHSASSGLEATLRNRIRRALPTMNVSVEWVDHIERSQSGKARVIINEFDDPARVPTIKG
jgi:phenylacetate-CoA ligase